MKKIKQLLLINILFVLISLTNVSADTFDYSRLSETLLNQDPDPVEAGETVEIRFKIEKLGNQELRDIKYELETKYPFTIDKSDTTIKNLGNWIGNSKDNEYYTLYYKLKVDKDAIEGDYELKLYQTSSDTSNKKEITFDIRVDEKESPNLVIGTIKTSPSKLIADYKEGIVDIEIVNIGDADANQVIIDMNLFDGIDESFGYSTRENIGTISAGESKNARFYIDTNKGLKKGNYATSLDIQYKDDNQDEINNVEEKINLSVFGRPEYIIEELVIDNLTPNSNGEIKLKLKNIGSKKSDSTSIQIFKDSSQPFSFEDSSKFIGQMNINSQGDATFDIEVDETAKVQNYKLKLQIRSVVDNNVLVDNEIIEVQINKKKDNPITQNNYFNYALYLTILIIGLVIGYRLGLKK